VTDHRADRGYYGPDSMTWRLTRERAMLLGGPRALLLQLAHPLVAAGVAAHSSFQNDPIQRLRRTLDATLAVVFGTTSEAEAAVARVNRSHTYVRGELAQPAGHFAAGAAYSAFDPDLLLWVHATLVDTTLRVFPEFVGPLTDTELALAYEESKIAARLFGVPDEVLPDDLPAFRAYVDRMLASEIAVAPFQRTLADEILAPRIRFVPRALFRPEAAVTIALLPERVRAAYGYELTRGGERVFDWSRRMVRGILPVLPSRVRYQPHARRAYRRIGRQW
jgi:uncharacterized protein (DUF2236 family)